MRVCLYNFLYLYLYVCNRQQSNSNKRNLSIKKNSNKRHHNTKESNPLSIYLLVGGSLEGQGVLRFGRWCLSAFSGVFGRK
jgi:hypothetical protein